MLPVSSRPPRPRKWSNRRKLTTGAIVFLAVAGTLVGLLWWTGALFAKPPYSGPTWTVHKEKLKITVVARGSLEAMYNGDIYCTVRSGTKGSTIATTIKKLVDAGVYVEKGQEVMWLDDSGFQEQLKDKRKDVESAYASKIQADSQIKIQKYDNKTDIEKAENALDLAKLDLTKYMDGDFKQAQQDVDGRIETATADYEDWKTRAAWSNRMVKKGLMSKVQADADKSREEGAKIALDKVKEEKRVLEKYTYDRTVKDLTAKVKEAQTNLEKTREQAQFKLDYLAADQTTKNSIWELESSRKKDIEDQIVACTVKAPQAGLVVYYVPEQVRGGGGSQQSIVAQGEPVRESQKMLQIPDLNHMLVNVRVPEAFVAHLRSEPSGGFKDESKMQLAQIKVDAYPKNLLSGHVKFVDTVASVQDWFAADVKVYKTLVAIDASRNEKMPKLKPGMSAEVTITADVSPQPVLVVPVQAVLGTITSGAQRKCFVVGADGHTQLRDIEIGMSNERLVEVKKGLDEGDKVVENPRALLDDSSDLKPGGKSRPEGQPGGGGGKGGGQQDPGKGNQKGGGSKGVGALTPNLLVVPDQPKVETAWVAPDAAVAKL
jgi:multidrug efflux pump subunit AcrA (membrane-fusion protein)